ncbi:hypothetical protein ACWDYJ_35420, partial [Streptomyces sp. NPDC003042]
SGAPPEPFTHTAQKWGHRRPFQWGQNNPLKTLSADGEFLSMTWHTPACPHHAADLILAEDN